MILIMKGTTKAIEKLLQGGVGGYIKIIRVFEVPNSPSTIQPG